MADNRTYIKVHDGMPDHPKVEPLSDAAFRLLVTTWCWCSRHLTDGHISARLWAKRGTARARRELIDAGLAEVLDDGDILVHDYLEHQRSAEQVEELRLKKQKAGSKGGKTRAANQADAKQVLEQPPGKRQAAAQAKSNTETEEVLRTSQTETEPVPPPAGSAIAPLAEAGVQSLIAEWIDHVPKRPPGNVIGQIGKQLRAMADEGIELADLRRGLAEWVDKGLHPSTLPSVVNEVMNRSAARASPNARPATTDLRVAQAQALKALYPDAVPARPPTVRGEITG